MIKTLIHIIIITLLTIITQIGGLAWLIAMRFKYRSLIFIAVYTTLSISALWIAPIFGREPLPCISDGAIQMQSKMYCALNRQYVTPELKEVLIDYATKMKGKFPDTNTLVLDANFPFLSSFPLLPHLSHSDGRKADLAFYYSAENKYLTGATRSPIGYFAFEGGPSDCPSNTISLRWNMTWLQDLWPNYQLDTSRMTAALQLLSDDDRIGKIFIEPHLKDRFGAQSDKIRFQGCRAARHDDHIHIQL